MKLFGYNLTLKKTKKNHIDLSVLDQKPEIKVQMPQELRPAIIKPVRNPVLGYYSDYKYLSRTSFQQPEYDLADVGRIEDVDSYVRQAFDKKVALMFKEGWDIVGNNPKTIRYIKARFEQIARASQLPTEKLLRKIGSSLVRKSNAFIIKVRDVKASGGRPRALPGTNRTLKPVAAYFVAPAETMEYKITNNKIVKWRQRMPDGRYREYRPEDVIHIFYNRKDGFIFGTPSIIPVIDDIRALRKIEEDIELLIYQHLFPLFQYKVGTDQFPAGITETGEREIDVVRREIEYMPTEGGIVTPHTHEIKAIGSEGRALRAENYLEHFKRRVFAGLGMSAVDFGEGDTANRATSDNMSQNLIDSVKDIQRVLEFFINNEIINELLLESTFGPAVLDQENICKLKFKEIDVELKIKKEAHYADQFNKDMITWDEARIGVGLEPIPIPSQKEIESDQDLSEQYPEWYKTRWKLFEEPKILMQSIDEPYSKLAKDVAKANITKAGEKSKAVTAAQATSQPVTSRQVKNAVVTETISNIKDILDLQLEHEASYDAHWFKAKVMTQMDGLLSKTLALQMAEFKKGYSSIIKPGVDFYNVSSYARRVLRDRIEFYINRLVRDILNSLQRKLSHLSDADQLKLVANAVFDSLSYRASFIEDVELRKAYNLGRLLALIDNGSTEASVTTIKDSCNVCSNTEGILDISNKHLIALDDIPPFHANCNCKLKPHN